MPYTPDAPPEAIKALPKAAQAIWIAAFNSAFRAIEGDEMQKESGAARVAWAAVGKKYTRTNEGKWVEKRSFVAGDRIIVEMNDGLDAYTSLSFKPIDAGLGVYQNEGSASDGRREAAALYFLMSSGWDVGRAVTWARRWGGQNGQVLKRVGYVREPGYPDHFAPIHQGRLAKAAADPELASKHIGFAEVMVPWTMDTQGSISTPEDVEAAAYRFMENPLVGIMHAEWGDVGTVVENFITREGDPDFEIPGTWVQGIRFNDMAWQKVLNRELTGLSIGGIGEKEPILDEVA